MYSDKTILITGAAGFIGFHITKRVLKEGYKVIGYDNVNSYYDVNLKNKRLELLNQIAKKEDFEWEFIKGDLENFESLKEIFKKNKFDLVINLAAQAGVRYSIEFPEKYITSNVKGFLNILECCKEFNVAKLIYASSSSVYGGNSKIPFAEDDKTDRPKNIYGVTKKSNELMAYTYSQLFSIKTIGLRFFTVYGPWGRPDQAAMSFTKNILERKSIKVFNKGDMARDFTFIDDVIEIMSKIINISLKDLNLKYPNGFDFDDHHNVINIGFGSPTKLMDFIKIIEKKLSLEAKKEFLEMPQGDIKETFADTTTMKHIIGNYSNTPIEKGLEYLINWYRDFYSFN